MRINFTSTDYSVVLRLTFNPIEGPDADGAVTVPIAGGSLTIDGTDYTGVTGSCRVPPEQKADPASQSGSYTGVFAFTLAPDTAIVLSGTVTGSFDGDRVFVPQSFTEVTLGAPLAAQSAFSGTLLPPPGDDSIAMGTASAMIKPS